MKNISLTASLALLLLLPSCSLNKSGTDAEKIEESALETEPAAKEDASSEESPAVEESKSEPEPEENVAAGAVSEPAAEEEVEDVQQLSSVEILWQVPGEAVEYYYLRHGVDSEKLGSKEKLAVKDLEKIDHPEHGPLFRYVISGVPSAQTIYFTIQAENQFGLSPESPVQEVDSE